MNDEDEYGCDDIDARAEYLRGVTNYQSAVILSKIDKSISSPVSNGNGYGINGCNEV